MRVTNQMSTNRMLLNINRNATRVDRLYSQLSTGKKISVPSDNPIIAARSLKFRTNISETEQYLRNTAQGQSWMGVTEEAFSNTLGILETLRSRLVYGASDTYTYSDRDKIVTEMRQLAVQIGSEMNVTYAGRYVFSGYRTNYPAYLTKDQPKANFNITQQLSMSAMLSTTAFVKSGLSTAPSIYDIFKMDLPYKGAMSTYPVSLSEFLTTDYNKGLDSYNAIWNLYNTLSYDLVNPPATPAIINANKDFEPVTVMIGDNRELNTANTSASPESFSIGNIGANLNVMNELVNPEDPEDQRRGFPRDGVFAIQVKIPTSAADITTYTMILDFEKENPDGEFSLDDFENYFKNALDKLADDHNGGVAFATFDIDSSNQAIKIKILDADADPPGSSLGGYGAQIILGAKTTNGLTPSATNKVEGSLPSGTVKYVNSSFFNYSGSNQRYPNKSGVNANLTLADWAEMTSANSDVNPLSTSDFASQKTKNEEVLQDLRTNAGDCTVLWKALAENNWNSTFDTGTVIYRIKNPDYPGKLPDGSNQPEYLEDGKTFLAYEGKKWSFEDLWDLGARTLNEANTIIQNSIGVDPNYISVSPLTYSIDVERDGNIHVAFGGFYTQFNFAYIRSEIGIPNSELLYYTSSVPSGSSYYAPASGSDPATITSTYPVEGRLPEDLGLITITIGSIPTEEIANKSKEITIDFSQEEWKSTEFESEEEREKAFLKKINDALNENPPDPLPTFAHSSYDPEYPVAKAYFDSNGNLVIKAAEPHSTVSVFESKTTRPIFDSGYGIQNGAYNTPRFIINGNPPLNIQIKEGNYDSIDDFIQANYNNFFANGWILGTDPTGKSLVIESVDKGPQQTISNVYITGKNSATLMDLLGISGLQKNDVDLIDGGDIPEYAEYDLDGMLLIAEELMEETKNIDSYVNNFLDAMNDIISQGFFDGTLVEARDALARFREDFQTALQFVSDKVEEATTLIGEAKETAEPSKSAQAAAAYQRLRDAFIYGGVDGSFSWDNTKYIELFDEMYALGGITEIVTDRVTLPLNTAYSEPNNVSNPKSADYDPADPYYDPTVDPNSALFENKKAENMKHFITAINGSVTTPYAVTTMSENDPDYDNRYNPGPNAINFIPATGELIFGKAVTEELRTTAKDGLSLDYNVKGLNEGELNPLVYFDCYDTIEGKAYDMNNQSLQFEFSTNTRIQVNSLAKDNYTASLYAELINFIDMIESIQISSEADLRAKYDDGTRTEEEVERLIKEQISEETKKFTEFMHQSFSTTLGRFEEHQSQVLKEYTFLGSRVNRLELISNRLEESRVSYTTLMSENEDIDYLEAIMKLQSTEAVYAASMNIGAKISQLTLADYIR